MLLAGGSIRGDRVSTARLSSRAPESLLHAPRTSKMQLQQAARDTIQPIRGLESAKL